MLNVPGLVAIIVFYVLILGIGLYAGWKRRGMDGEDEVMLAGRSIGYFVGILTMTATWVGGGYINGSAEAIYNGGLISCQAPFGYSISLLIGGLFYAKKMRDANYVTMLDPLQNIFGMRWGAMLFLPALAGETLWSASILAALGSTLVVILGISSIVSIIVSASIAVVYTLFGGLYSVAYTDVVQLFCIFIGLWLSVPFAMQHEAVRSLSLNETNWLGYIEPGSHEWGKWSDYAILLIFGGIPWQAYFQRVLSAKSSKRAQVLSCTAAFGCFIMAVPACLIGAIAKATDWEKTGYGKALSKDDTALVLPLVLQYLTPVWVAFFGLGAVSAAVMSSADSSVLSASSMFARNIYKNVFRPRASEREIIWVMRAAVIAVAISASAIAIRGHSIYELFSLCGDFVYVMLFPQLTLAVHAPNYVNTYGSMVGFTLGFILRVLGGEKVLGIPVTLEYPWFKDGVQYFPFRTLSMVVTFVSLLLVSWLTRFLFEGGHLPPSVDIIGVFNDDSVVVITPLQPKGLDRGVDNLALEDQKGTRNGVNNESKINPQPDKQTLEMTTF